MYAIPNISPSELQLHKAKTSNVESPVFVCPFDYTAVVGSGKVGSINQLTTPVGWPQLLQSQKSVRNRCVIELFCGVVCVVTLPFWHFCWYRGFCHGTESDLSFFFSEHYHSKVLLWILNKSIDLQQMLFFFISYGVFCYVHATVNSNW